MKMRQLLGMVLLLGTVSLCGEESVSRVIDLTHTLSEETLVYPGKTPLTRVTCAYYESGYHLQDMALGTGIGTHMDAPSHFCKGYEGIDEVALEQCVGPACVLHLASIVKDSIDYVVTRADIQEWEALHGTILAHAMVLVHTGWDRHWGSVRFCEPDGAGICHFPGIAQDAAELLRERRVAAVGIDTMGIDRGIDFQFPAHKVLLGAHIPIVENLAQLGALPAKGATVYFLPMKLKGAPEAPVRAMAVF